MKEKLERIVTVEPSWNKIDSNPSKNYGISNCKIRFVLKGKKGAVQFLIGTEWGIESVRKHLQKFPVRDINDYRKPSGWDVGYHSPKPLYKGQSSMKCDLMPRGKCYYDGSGLRADEWIEGFMAGGTEWLWKKLEEEYNETFKKKKP